jgi:hypothetical protein
MLDALLIYYCIINMRHAGYLRVVAEFMQGVKVRYTLARSLLPRAARQDAPQRLMSSADGAIDLALQTALTELLRRLETYVASMA